MATDVLLSTEEVGEVTREVMTITTNTNAVGNPVVGRVHVTEGEAAPSPKDEIRVAIPLRGEEALRGLLQVDPQSEPTGEPNS